MGMSSSVDVLLVDDQRIDADVTLLALRRIAPDLRVLTLKSGNEALQYLFAAGEFARCPRGRPRIVLLDAQMPIISGLCVLDIIRAHPITSGLPVVILSSQPLQRILRRDDKFAADGYIVKQWDLTSYAALLERSMRRWLPRTPSSDDILNSPNSAATPRFIATKRLAHAARQS